MAENFDFVVIDGEAGVEQVNRRVMANDSILNIADCRATASVRDCLVNIFDHRKEGGA